MLKNRECYVAQPLATGEVESAEFCETGIADCPRSQLHAQQISFCSEAVRSLINHYPLLEISYFQSSRFPSCKCMTKMLQLSDIQTLYVSLSGQEVGPPLYQAYMFYK